MITKTCPFCGYPADTKTGVHNFRDDCLRAALAENAKLRQELERTKCGMVAIEELVNELAELEK